MYILPILTSEIWILTWLYMSSRNLKLRESWTSLAKVETINFRWTSAKVKLLWFVWLPADPDYPVITIYSVYINYHILTNFTNVFENPRKFKAWFHFNGENVRWYNYILCLMYQILKFFDEFIKHLMTINF